MVAGAGSRIGTLGPSLYLAWALAFFFMLCPDPSSAVGRHRVKGHFRSNGSYVQAYWRTNPDGIKSNNYSYPGNYNPNTGTITEGMPSGAAGGGYGDTSPGSAATFPLKGADGVTHYAYQWGDQNGERGAVFAPSGIATLNGYVSALDLGGQSAIGGGISLAVMPASGAIQLPGNAAIRLGIDLGLLGYDVEPEALGFQSSDYSDPFNKGVSAEIIKFTPGFTARFHKTLPFGGLYFGARTGMAITWTTVADEVEDRTYDLEIQPFGALQFLVGSRTTLDVAVEKHQVLDEEAWAFGMGFTWLY